jgi:hypothetical protein
MVLFPQPSQGNARNATKRCCVLPMPSAHVVIVILLLTCLPCTASTNLLQFSTLSEAQGSDRQV